MQRNPIDELEQLFDRMSRQVESAAGDFESVRHQSVPIDLADHGEEFVLTADLPGFEREQIDVTLAGRTLSLDAELEASTAESEETEDGGEYIRRERRHDVVHRTVTLPEDVEKEAVAATYDNGILTVTLPKAEVEESQQIEIE
jgi:HSP20 family protein